MNVDERVRHLLLLVGSAAAVGLASPSVFAQTTQARLDTAEAAGKFGALEDIENIALSPDGTKLAVVRPGKGRQNGAVVINLATGASATAAFADGDPLRMTDCDWINNHRLVCEYYGVLPYAGTLAPFTRLTAVNDDGSDVKPLGPKDAQFGATTRQFDGEVLD